MGGIKFSGVLWDIFIVKSAMRKLEEGLIFAQNKSGFITALNWLSKKELSLRNCAILVFGLVAR